MPTLNKFLDWVKEGKIRDNVEQSAGWLVLIGASEYDKMLDPTKHFEYMKKPTVLEPIESKAGMGWKCGAYEPCQCQHGDIEYLYTIDLDKKEITYKHI